ncbi:MAG: bifunctional serine/threonine-protein kinase/formylglycine-generating enzyme family protein [Planctomycetota bacterium]
MDVNVADTCPDDDVLAAFASGQMAEADLARVGEHLEHCSKCVASLSKADPFTQNLQRIHQEGFSPWAGLTAGAADDGPYFFNIGDEPPLKDPERFFEALAQSRLFDVQDMKEVRREWKAFRSDDLGAFAQTLALEGRLTDFHVRQLLRGKVRGWVLGDYVILHPLSAGGMEWVYQAFHRRHKRTYALKVTSPQTARTLSAVKRFHREIETIAKLKHPRLVAAVDAGEAEGLDYLVMEEMPGHSLAEWVELNGPMRCLTAVDMIREASEGIAAAHEAGVIHRNLKPSNLWVEVFTGATRAGSSGPGVKVLDFGMAQMTAADASRSSSGHGTLVGTAGYVAPEQVKDSRAADARSDIYSLGCCLAFLLSGKNPPSGSPPTQLESPKEAVPGALQAIYRRMVAEAPKERYATADELIVDLDAFLAGTKIASPRRTWMIAAFVVGTLLVGLTTWLMLRPRGEPVAVVSGPRPAPLEGATSSTDAAALQKKWAAALNMPVEITNRIGMKLRFVPPGTMPLGTPAGQIDERLGQLVPGSDTWQWLRRQGRLEWPRHRVTLTQPYYLGATEVTVEQFRTFVEATKYQTTAEADGLGGVSSAKGAPRQSPRLTWRSPGYDLAETHPVVQVSFADAQAFCQWLSQYDGRTYELPTEAQWEFAARSGGTERWFWGDRPDAVRDYVAVDARYGPQAVARKQPNAFGLYDTAGNVAEWCSDWFEADEPPAANARDPKGPERGAGHAVRGGAFLQPLPDSAASAARLAPPDAPQDFIGFRVLAPIRLP